MGGGWSKKKEPPPRRFPLTTLSEVLDDEEAIDKIKDAVKVIEPGKSSRWNKILDICNTNLEPTEEDPDPLRLQLTLEELDKILHHFYATYSTTDSDDLKLMRRYDYIIPKSYIKLYYILSKSIFWITVTVTSLDCMKSIQSKERKTCQKKSEKNVT